jgi:zinc/manganese transport system substrate-binding protein
MVPTTPRPTGTRTSRAVATLAVSILAVAGCGSDTSGDDGDDRPKVVVTTNILGNVVDAATDGLVDVQVIMPIGSEPHDFAPSARQAEAMENADLLVTNGAGFEAGMTGVIDNVADSGTPVFVFADQVEIVDGDPHFWTDPSLIDAGLDALELRLADVDGIDDAALAANVDAYRSELDTLQDSIEQAVAAVPEQRRILVTNHEVFGYYAARFGFDVVGAVIPSLSTDAEPSAAGLEALAETIRAENVPVIFGETTQSTQVAEALANEVGDDIEIVELFSESLGDDGSGAETYLAMMTTNTELITAALSA